MTSEKEESRMQMTFSEKVDSSIQSLVNVENPHYPKEEINLYADFIELLALSAGNDGISYGDILDRLFGEYDETNESTHNDDSVVTNPAERNDTNESFIDRLFLLINERVSQYGELYPFMIRDDRSFVLKDNLSDSQKLYLFLLLSSSLDVFHLFNSELTTDFEIIAFETMRSFLPNAIVKSFGKNSEYSGTAKEKIKQLAKDIGLPINEYEIDQIGERNNQERGLDVVGWLPFPDNCQNKIVFLCQCSCGKNYEYKQHDIRRFKNYYVFYKTKPQHTLFIPYSLINPKEGKFYYSDLIEDDYLIFERFRILNINKDNAEVFESLRTKGLVERCISVCQ